MSRIIILIFILSTYSLYSQVDIMKSDTCLPRENLYKYGFKIYELQKKIEILTDISDNKDSIIHNRMSQIELYKSTIKEHQFLLTEYDKSQKLNQDIINLQKIRIEELQPKWYDRKELWLGTGLILGILIML